MDKFDYFIRGVNIPHVEGKSHTVILYKDDHDQLHRDDEDQPAVIVRVNDSIVEQRWIQHGVYTRSYDLATIVRYYKLEDGQYGPPREQLWYAHTTADAHLSRGDDRPACIKFDELGRVAERAWMVNGKLHRTSGPAVVNDNNVEYWLEGQELTYNEWSCRVNPIRELTLDQIEHELGYRVKLISIA